SSAGRSGTERSSARASGSSTLRPASVPGILLQWQVAEGGGQAVVVVPGRDRAPGDLHLVDLVGAVGEAAPAGLLEHVGEGRVGRGTGRSSSPAPSRPDRSSACNGPAGPVPGGPGPAGARCRARPAPPRAAGAGS